jgi:hypothetical protein
MDKKKAGDILQNTATGLAQLGGMGYFYIVFKEQRQKDNAAKLIASKEATIDHLRSSINLGIEKGTEFVDTKDYVNKNGELVTGKYVTFNHTDKIEQLKTEIKHTRAEDMQLSFWQNAATAISIGDGLFFSILTYKGIGYIRQKFGENIDNFCDGVGHKVRNVFKPRAPNEV